jgi:hypothetical protein
MDKKALTAALTATAVVTVGIGIGSHNLLHYDPALLIYTFGTLLSAYVITYRVTLFLQRPPTKRYAIRGVQLLTRKNQLRNLFTTARVAGESLVAQRFILERSKLRWLAHFLFAWGTLIAGAVTFPLVFGWMHFETPVDDPRTYLVMAFGQQVTAFPLDSIRSFVIFNVLNISAVMVIVGVCIALHRRLYAPGRSRARQQFGRDLVPLIMLLAISITGLMLTFSMHFMDGYGYAELSLIHALIVIITLVYLPFGKFFHIFVRPLQVVIGLYRKVDSEQPPAECRVCGDGFAGQMHVADLKSVLAEMGQNWTFDDGTSHYADVCPKCRRRLMGATHQAITNQSRNSEDIWQS